MSVLKSQQTKSNVEFLRQSRELELLMIRVCDKKAKKHQAFLTRELVLPAARVYTYIKSANAIFINKKELDLYIMRRNMFRQAITLLQGISAQLDIFHDLYSSDGFSNHEYQELIGYTTELIYMISAVILYDKEKAEKLGLLGEDC